MKKFTPLIIFIAVVAAGIAYAKQAQEPGYILEHANDIAAAEPGPHDGLGKTTAYKYFTKAKDSKLEFRRRALHTGASIGYHLQKSEEIYFIESGTGEMEMNGKSFSVKAGDAILTHNGSSHGLKQTGKDDLVVVIVYNKPAQ